MVSQNFGRSDRPRPNSETEVFRVPLSCTPCPTHSSGNGCRDSDVCVVVSTPDLRLDPVTRRLRPHPGRSPISRTPRETLRGGGTLPPVSVYSQVSSLPVKLKSLSCPLPSKGPRSRVGFEFTHTPKDEGEVGVGDPWTRPPGTTSSTTVRPSVTSTSSTSCTSVGTSPSGRLADVGRARRRVGGSSRTVSVACTLYLPRPLLPAETRLEDTLYPFPQSFLSSDRIGWGNRPSVTFWAFL